MREGATQLRRRCGCPLTGGLGNDTAQTSAVSFACASISSN